MAANDTSQKMDSGKKKKVKQVTAKAIIVKRMQRLNACKITCLSIKGFESLRISIKVYNIKCQEKRSRKLFDRL